MRKILILRTRGGVTYTHGRGSNLQWWGYQLVVLPTTDTPPSTLVLRDARIRIPTSRQRVSRSTRRVSASFTFAARFMHGDANQDG